MCIAIKIRLTDPIKDMSALVDVLFDAEPFLAMLVGRH